MLRRRPLATALGISVVAVLLLQLGARGQRENTSDEQVLWAAYWTVQPGFTSTLEMKNNRIAETLTVQLSLYFPNGEEYELDPLQLGPRQPTVISLNQIMESLPAAVAARAGKEGSLEVSFRATSASALMGSVSVTNPERGIAWNFFMYPVNSAAPVVPVRGVFWFHDADTDGFIVVHNASEERMQVSPRFELAGTSHPLTPFSLRGGQFYKLALRQALATLGLENATAGGIEFSYEGAPDALKAHGVLFNNRGFSAEIDFTRADTWEEELTLGLRTPRFAVGPADPRLGLPRSTSFDPVVVLHNFRRYPMNITLAVGYTIGDGQQELSIPMTLPPGDTQVIPLHPYLENVLPQGTHWASLEVSYTGRQSGLAAAMVSVSQDGEHSIRSVLNWVEANTREGWHWRVDRDTNTLLGIFNADAQEARVRVSLDYYAEGLRQSYDLPEMPLPGRSSELLDIGGIIAAGLPDAEGDTIPPTVTFGGYRVRKVAGNPSSSIVTEALLINRRTKNFLAFYNTGCCQSDAVLDPDSVAGLVDDLWNVRLLAWDLCSGEVYDLSVEATYWSLDTTVADGSSGVVSLLGPGTTTVQARALHEKEWPTGCRYQTSTGSCSVQSYRISVDLNPPLVAPQGATSVIVTLEPAQSGRTVTLQASELPFSGGHQHLGRPLGSFTPASGTTDQTGRFQSSYTASAFGGAESIRATVSVAGGLSKSANLDVQIQGLASLGSGANYILRGSTTTHPQNHFGTSTANAGLQGIASQYAAEFPGSSALEYNDQSLIHGGLFDIGPPYGPLWSPPHDSHRTGSDCDVYDGNVPQARWARLEQIFVENGVTFFQHETARNHWHVRF